MIKYKDLKKGDMIRSVQLGRPISGKLLESPKQGRGLKKAILIFTNGEDMGLHAEAGSIYAHQLTLCSSVNGSCKRWKLAPGDWPA